MDDREYRNNPQNPDDKVDAQNGERTESDVRRERTDATDQKQIVEREHGLAHGELEQHAQEFQSSAGKTVSPTVDPPNDPEPEEDTAPPR